MDLQSAFIKQIESLISSYNETRIVFDNYLDQSVKNKTRQKRVVSSIEFKINIEIKLTMWNKAHNVYERCISYYKMEAVSDRNIYPCFAR